jgi:hypothetical protein
MHPYAESSPFVSSRHDIQLDTHAAAVLIGPRHWLCRSERLGFLQQAVPRTFWCCAAIPPLSFLGHMTKNL